MDGPSNRIGSEMPVLRRSATLTLALICAACALLTPGQTIVLPLPTHVAMATSADVENPPLDSIEAAETEAAAYPSTAPPDPLPAMFAEEGRAGTPERRCAETDDSAEVRSGEFIAGPFNHGRTGKMWWVPLHTPGSPLYPAGINSLVVRATRLDQTVESIAFSYSHLAWTEGPGRVTFFPSDLYPPTEGRWMLVATSGPNWGCFIWDLK